MRSLRDGWDDHEALLPRTSPASKATFWDLVTEGYVRDPLEKCVLPLRILVYSRPVICLAS